MTDPFKSLVGSCALIAASLPLAIAQAPHRISQSGSKVIATLHAQGAQVYECRRSAGGELVWDFREPIATLIANGRSVGRHYAGPSWELDDGSVVIAAVTARAPAGSTEDIPLLWLKAQSHRGQGLLAEVTTVERANTKGGMMSGPCSTAGELRSVPYSADYRFLKASP